MRHDPRINVPGNAGGVVGQDHGGTAHNEHWLQFTAVHQGPVGADALDQNRPEPSWTVLSIPLALGQGDGSGSGAGHDSSSPRMAASASIDE